MNPARISPASQDNFDGSETRPARPGLVNFLRHLVSIMTPADRLLFFVLLGISLLSIFGVRLLLSNGRTASVIVNKRLIKTFSLAVDETYEITAAAGAVVLRVAGNGVQVARSNCPEKICVRQGRISRRGQVIVCVPNKLIVTVDGEIERPLDAITP